MRRFGFFIVAVLVNLQTSISFGENFRLPRILVPYHYNIQILTDLADDFSYKGKVFIDFKVTENTKAITLHSKNLVIFENETRLEELLTADLEHAEGKQARDFKDATIPNAMEKEASSKESAAFDKTSPSVIYPDDPKEITKEKQVESSTSGPEVDKSPSTVHPSSSLPLTPTSSADRNPSASSTTTSESLKTTTEEVFILDVHSKPPDEEPVTFIGIINTQEETSKTIEPPTSSPTTTPEATAENSNGNHSAIKHEYHKEYDFLTIYFEKPLVKGKKYRLYVKYEGILADTLTGFYRVPYTKRNPQKSTWLASTVFEPSEARTAFPCFDEPDLKATFDVTLGHEKKFTALSNMPMKATSPVAGMPEWQWTTFETTPLMPTYLVAFFISDLEYLTPRSNATNSERNVTYRFWARHDVLYRTRYAMRIAPEMKNYLEDLFQVRDVLPKHDFIALPSFVSNALENWGLYSFAEKNILFTPGFSSIFSKFQITQVLAHEVAHMWFGNMVTPKWWDQIWLSEGFANFFEVVAADHVQPGWDLKTTAAVFAYFKVFSLDALHSSHSLVPKFDDPKDLNEIFNSISYQKGFYLVRMLNYTLGEEAFMSGIRKYLKTHLLSNVDEDDLWEALNDFAHQEGNLPQEFHFKEIMHNWTKKPGYPILEVTRDYDNNTATVSQRRFLRLKGDYEFRGNTHDDEEEDTKWWVPLTYTTGSELNFRETKPRLWLSPQQNSITLTDMPSRNDFVLMNLDAAGLYRVNYDERNWGLIISYLINENHSEISMLNRVQLLDDLLDMARSGDVSYEMALEATGYLKKEKHFLPWKAALGNFDFISRMFRSRDSNRTLRKFLRHLISPRFEELGFDVVKNETFSDSMNRKQIATWACRTGLRQCTRKSNNLFKKWMQERRPDENNPIPSSLRSVVYCSAIENGGSREWQFLWQRYLNNALTDKTAILQGLGCTKNTRTLKKYLDWSIRESSGIRKQDAPVIFKSVALNDAGFYHAKNFLKERMNDLRVYLGNNPFFLPQMIDTLASKMNHPNDLQDLVDMKQRSFSDYRSVPRSFKQAFEKVRFNIDWTKKNYQVITDWLRKQKI